MNLNNIPQLTKEQAAVIGLYTGFTCGPFSDIHQLAEHLEGGPIFTHQFADKKRVKLLKQKVRPLFLKLCHERGPCDK